jgi:hypothetical protein
MEAVRLDILGVPFPVPTGMLVRAKAHAALVAYCPYMLTETYQTQTLDAGTFVVGDCVTKAIDAVATVPRQYGVPQKAFNTGDIAELQCGGPGLLTVTNVTGPILLGSFLKLIPGTSTTAAQLDGATVTVNSIALSCEAYNSATPYNAQVQFIPRPIVCNT